MICNPHRSPIETVDESWSVDGVLFVDHTLNKYCVREVPDPGLEIAEMLARRYERMGEGFRCVVLCVDGEKAHKPAVRDERDARTASATIEFVHNNSSAIDARMFDELTRRSREPAGNTAESPRFDETVDGRDGPIYCIVMGSGAGGPGRMVETSDPDHVIVNRVRDSLASSDMVVEADHLMFHVAKHLADLGTRCVISSKDSDVFGSLLVLGHDNISVRYQTDRYKQERSSVDLSIDMIQTENAGSQRALQQPLENAVGLQGTEPCFGQTVGSRDTNDETSDSQYLPVNQAVRQTRHQRGLGSQARDKHDIFDTKRDGALAGSLGVEVVRVP